MQLNERSTAEEAVSALHWFFGQFTKAYAKEMQRVLECSVCEFSVDTLQSGLPAYQFAFHVPPDDYEWAKIGPFKKHIQDAVFHLVEDDSQYDQVAVMIKMLLPKDRRPVGLNNCFFKQENTLLHDELRFRSKGEIAIYDELRRRDVLVLPNPAVVMGKSAAEYGANILKREPDFLICYKGKWGMLEINGDDFHSGLIQTTKDHDRARLFQHYGLFFIQSFDLKRCKTDPVGVVDEFLKLLANHKG
jgi:hypothetical protein